MKRLILLLLISAQVWAQTKGWKPIAKSDMPAGMERRLALVVGNKNYTRADARLQNPLNDANDMTVALEALGFDVIKRTDLNLVDFKKAVDEFGSRLSDYNVALFYYSGHGIQFNGENYLVPIDATLQTLSDTEDDCLRLGRVMGKMKAANVKNNLVFLDACRNNPFPKTDGSRGTPQKGLVIPNNPAGTMVVFATEEGSTADDNSTARNGLFTSVLLQHLGTPNLSLSDIVLNTRQGVYERSGNRQLPADYNKMLGAFYFVKTNTPPKREEPTRTEPKTSPTGRKAVFMDLPFADMVYVPGGTFEMGDVFGEGYNDEKPVHTVTVSSFLMGKYEVTQRQWQEIMGNNPSEFKNCDDCPVENVSWDDIQVFLQKLNAREGRSGANAYRLPTEAEWEYAARGGGKRVRFGNGSDVLDPSEANFNASDSYKRSYSIAGSYRAKTISVGSFKPNGMDLHDMTGNVWEWCADRYSAYSSTSQDNPTGHPTASNRVLRGGSWRLSPANCRVADRGNFAPSFRYSNVGFRVVCLQ